MLPAYHGQVSDVLAKGKGRAGDALELVQFSDGWYGILRDDEPLSVCFRPDDLDPALEFFGQLMGLSE